MSKVPDRIPVSFDMTRPGRGVWGMTQFLGGIVETQYGQAEVTLSLNRELPGAPEVPAYFVVSFPTREHPNGLVLHLDVTTMLEQAARAYFTAVPTDRPLVPKGPGGPPPRLKRIR